MTQRDDPFGLFDDSDRTVVIRPQPGGRAPLPPSSSPPPPVADPGVAVAAGSVGRNPLVRAAAPVLALAPHLKTPAPPGDPESLRLRIGEQIQRVERDALAAGADRETARLAAWSLAALIDDVVLNTPWGGHGGWAAKSLVGTLFHEVAAGERFFERLSLLEREPGRHRDLLELMYLCLSLGFEGRYRLQGGRAGAGLEGVRDGLFRLIAPRDQTADLSPAWKGVEAAHRPLAAAVPLWVVGAATLALLALLYTGFAFRLAGTTEQIGPLLQALPPQGPVQLVRELRPPPEVPRPAPPPPRLPTAIKPKIEQFLAPEVRDGIVTVEEDAQRVLIRLRDQGLFGSGRADLNTAFIEPLERLGRALDDEPGRIIVIGHSDNVPIRTPRFPSNWELSRARAEAVAGMLSLFLRNPGRIASDGRAETEPIASNATPEGRAANRRVEVLLIKDG